jgi:hypothetical protein
LGGGQIINGPFNISCPVGLDDRKTKESSVRIELRRLTIAEDIPGLKVVVSELVMVLS